jgi:hypothetical protein
VFVFLDCNSSVSILQNMRASLTQFEFVMERSVTSSPCTTSEENGSCLLSTLDRRNRSKTRTSSNAHNGRSRTS